MSESSKTVIRKTVGLYEEVWNLVQKEAESKGNLSFNAMISLIVHERYKDQIAALQQGSQATARAATS